jgi:hypothetical protein
MKLIKICPNCKTPKPCNEEHFYTAKHTGDGFGSWCKDCMKRRKKVTSIEPLDKGEQFALNYFANRGIPSLLGKNVKTTKWVDVILWGCIRVEVKYSTRWHWHFYSTVYNPDTMPDVIMLIGKSEKGYDRVFILDAKHPLFFRPSGERKISLAMREKVTKKKSLIRDTVFAHEDNFALIEQKRVSYSQQLIEIARAA